MSNVGLAGAVAPVRAQARVVPKVAQAAPTWDQRSIQSGDRRIQANAWFGQLRASLKVGDVVLVHGHDGFITPMDGNASYIHAAIVSSTSPLKLVEAWGPNDSGNASVREVPFAEFVDGTRGDGYKLVRPTTDPAAVQAAVAFAKQQVGKTYDWSFGLFGHSAGSAWYCSDLVHAAYATAPGGNPLAIDKNPERDRTLAVVHDVAAALRLQDPAKMTQLISMAYNSPLLVSADRARYTVPQLASYLQREILAGNPVFAPLMRSKAGSRLFMDASTELAQRFTKGGSLDVRSAFLGRFQALGLRDKASVVFALLRGATHLRFGQLWQAWQASRKGALAGELVSPQDLADGKNAASWTFGAAT